MNRTCREEASNGVHLLAAFAKNEKANLSKAERNEMAKFVKTLFKTLEGTHE